MKCYATRLPIQNKENQWRWSNTTETEKFNRLRVRFEKYVVKQEGCWDWKGCIHRSGYAPMLFLNPGQQKNAHIVSWILHNGEVPKGLWVLHKCDNRKCTNPEHLFLGTAKDNTDDKDRKNRGNHAHGESHTHAILTVEKVKEIRKKLSMGITMKRLSEEYNISSGALYAIKKNTTWKHVV